jgi:hypothetical protein
VSDLLTYAQQLQTRRFQNRSEVFDPVRKLWVALTPEEMVRQSLLIYLIKRGYEPTLIAVEKQITIGEVSFRFDVIVFDEKFKPLILVECKAPEVALNQEVFDQVARYNWKVQAPYFILTNGVVLLIGKHDNDKRAYEILNELPEKQKSDL